MAERGRFELPEAFTSAVFKTAALNHSTISPQFIRYGNITLLKQKIKFFYPEKFAFSVIRVRIFLR